MRRLRLFVVAAGFLIVLAWPAVARAEGEPDAAVEPAAESEEVVLAEADADVDADAAADAAAAPADPAEPVLDELFGDVTITNRNEADGYPGPDFDDPFTEAGSSMSGTRHGDEAVLYRVDADTGTPETWVWDGRTTSWWESPGATQPGARYFQAAAGLPWDDPTGGEALLYGGTDLGFPATAFGDTWVLGSDYQWYLACGACAPGPLWAASAANSEWETFLFGGEDGSGVINNTVWQWAGADWVPANVGPGAAPAGRLGAGFTFDGRDFILFGGVIDDGAGNDLTLGDTWRLWIDATGTWWWEQVFTVLTPPARALPGLAGLYWWDDPTPGAIMVGGYRFDPDGTTWALSDKWAWDGEEWYLTDAGIGTYFINFFDPTTWVSGVPYSPKAASMPAIGAAVWTAGDCTFDPQTEEGVCTRITQQINLPERVEVVTVLPFTGRSMLPVVLFGISVLLAGAFLTSTPTFWSRRTARLTL